MIIKQREAANYLEIIYLLINDHFNDDDNLHKVNKICLIL